MKYLFIIQGEGRGHLTQALSLKKMLQTNGHEVVGMLVGKSKQRVLPHFFKAKAEVPIQQFDSPNFLPTPAGKRSMIGRSVVYNLIKTPIYIESLLFIRKQIAESGADAVINFYELLTGLAYGLFNIRTPYFCIGHQYLFLHRDFRFPTLTRGNLFMLKFFTRLTSLRCECRLALSFREMEPDDNERIKVVPPLLRNEVLHLSPHKGDYILGYMVNAGFAEEVQRFHHRQPDVRMHFFWDKHGAAEETYIDPTLTFYTVNDRKFLTKMQGCRAYATTAGFESVCEAMYLGKPVLMVPAHIEQDCNAFDAESTGAGIVSTNFDLGRLNALSQTFRPNRKFAGWVHKAKYRILPLLEPQPHEEAIEKQLKERYVTIATR